jgi:tRNA1(Val) A37 N6-methylase TrmN6
MKAVEDLFNGYKLIQHDRVHKLGTDAVLLAAWAPIRRNSRVCDLGCGAGAVSLLLAARYPEALIDGVEIQEKAAELFEESILLNGQGNRMRVYLCDLKRLPSHMNGSYSNVVCNPPYNRKGSGIEQASREKQIERDETEAKFSDICAGAGKLLKFGGSFSVVCRTDRLADVIFDMRGCGIEPKRLRFVQNKADSSPVLFLLDGRRGGAGGITVLPPFVLRNGEGFTDEFSALYRGERM